MARTAGKATGSAELPSSVDQERRRRLRARAVRFAGVRYSSPASVGRTTGHRNACGGIDNPIIIMVTAT